MGCALGHHAGGGAGWASGKLLEGHALAPAPLRLVRPDPGPLPSPNQSLTVADLDEAWREGVPSAWSAQRIAICVLDAHGAAMPPDDALAFVTARSRWMLLSADSARYWRRGAAVGVRDDGLWQLDRAHDAVRSARQAVRERLGLIRRWAHMRPDRKVLEANRKRFEREREAHAERLAARRAAAPPRSSVAFVMRGFPTRCHRATAPVPTPCGPTPAGMPRRDSPARAAR